MVEEVEEVEEKMENQENESPVKKGGELRTETENFRELFEKSLKKISEHAIVKGTVIRITDSDVIVDIGSKSEGVISKNEFFDKRKNLEVEVGDVISIYLEKTEDDSGAMVLSYEKALQIQAWDKITEALKENTPITGVITGAVKGGFTVDIGFKAFLPGSLADINFTKNMNEYIGKTFQFKVIKCDRKTLNILISRKAFLEEERKGNREKLLETLKEGDIVKGKVKSFASYGAFIDIGGVDALLHNKEISWGKINKPEDVLKIGDEIELKVIKYNKEIFKISVSLKQLTADPWKTVIQKYPVGSKVKGTVVNILDFGAFVELEPGIEGLIHISEMSWSKKIAHPSKILSNGDIVETVVLNIDEENNRISLGLKQVLENPWETFELKYPAGSQVSGIIKNFTNFGIFVEVAEGIDGLVHINDISWTDFSPDIPSLFKIGDKIDVIVLKVDKYGQKISLGIKQLTDDPWKSVVSKYPKGAVVKAKVNKVIDKGLVVEIDKDFEGFIPILETGVEKSFFKKTFKDGDEVEGIVLNYNSIERRIVISIKALKDQFDRYQLKKLMENNESATTKLSEVLKKVMT